MNRSTTSRALFGVLALAASSIVHARPVVFEPRDDATFSMRVGIAVPGLAMGRPDFALSGASTTHGGNPLFGVPHATPPFGGTISLNNSTSLVGANSASFDSGQLAVFGWESNSRSSSNHRAHTHEWVGAVVAESMLNDMFMQEHSVATVSAVPEPSTFAPLALGLAGIAVMTRRRRLGGR
jgi:hypothetical protein